MGVFSAFRNRARQGFPILKRVAEALLAKGSYQPQVTGTSAAGATVVLQEERVEAKGVLRSTTVLFGIGTALTTGVAIWTQVKAGTALDDPALQASIVAFLGALGAIWRHIRSWMPTKGAATPPSGD